MTAGAPYSPAEGNVACSFCGKLRRNVEQMVMGPAVQICNECVATCADIIGYRFADEGGVVAEDPVALRAELNRLTEEIRRHVAE